MTPKNPSIILVRPQLPENIGMVARVMHNFGLKDLVLVSPKDNWLNSKSINASKKANKIIMNSYQGSYNLYEKIITLRKLSKVNP